MKSLLIILLAITFQTGKIDSKLKGSHELTAQEAQRILGEPCHLQTTEDTLLKGVQTHKSTFLANSASSPKKITLYYMFESYRDNDGAKKIFESYWESNGKSQGFELMSNLGDQAFFHNDGHNFNLLIVRKGNKMVRFKINKTTPKTSTDELKLIANEVVGRI